MWNTSPEYQGSSQKILQHNRMKSCNTKEFLQHLGQSDRKSETKTFTPNTYLYRNPATSATFPRKSLQQRGYVLQHRGWKSCNIIENPATQGFGVSTML
nr:MAG TPA: hypothetical protein [Caudoviricetes sp.]